jgi:glutamine amidotransferase
MIVIIDYGMGNVRSLRNAVEYIGHTVLITNDSRKIADAQKIILPGVGAFGDAMGAIRRQGLDEILHQEVIEKGKPMLGICLGLQLLAKSSKEHGYHEGLSWLDARVIGFDSAMGLKIPHIGWNDIDYSDPVPLFTGLKKGERSFYFVHSYYIVCNDPSDVLATCEYGINFTAAIKHDNFLATQFHPEKSQDNGIHVLKNFLSWNA